MWFGFCTTSGILTFFNCTDILSEVQENLHICPYFAKTVASFAFFVNFGKISSPENLSKMGNKALRDDGSVWNLSRCSGDAFLQDPYSMMKVERRRKSFYMLLNRFFCISEARSALSRIDVWESLSRARGRHIPAIKSTFENARHPRPTITGWIRVSNFRGIIRLMSPQGGIQQR